MGSRGQILIPALFIFPSLFLFVYLIYETARLSREKIRHQFAIDSAAFIEMSNYSDFMNRTAYVNGAFPMRIFHEFGVQLGDTYNKHNPPASYLNSSSYMYDLYFANGDFPRDPDWAAPGSESHMPDDAYTQKAQWKIEYCGSQEDCVRNQGGQSIPDVGQEMSQLFVSDPPTSWPGTCKLGPTLSSTYACHMLFNYDSAYAYYTPIAYSCLDPNYQGGMVCGGGSGAQAGVFTSMYVKVYQLLGEVEQAQYEVLYRLALDHHFLVKSYWLNTSGQNPDLDAGQNAMVVFGNSANGFIGAFQPVCLTQIAADGRSRSQTKKDNPNPIAPGINWTPEWELMGAQIYGFGPYNVAQIPGLNQNASNPCQGGGLFQLAYIRPSFFNIRQPTAGGMGPAWSANAQTAWYMPGKTQWSPGDNFFRQAFANANPTVCATATLGESPDPYASVWPDPTPKFQTRLRPCGKYQ